MGKKRILLIFLAVVTVAGAVIYLLPKQYAVMVRRSGVFALWKDDDLLVFSDSAKMGRAENFLQRKLHSVSQNSSLFLFLLMTRDVHSFGQETVAYHVSGGKIEKLDLPDNFGRGTWTSFGDDLIYQPWEDSSPGWKWNGHGLTQLTPAERSTIHEAQAKLRSTVKADDQNDEDEEGPSPYKALKDAGWHYKQLYYVAKQGQTVLPISLTQSGDLSLVLDAAPAHQKDANDLYERAGGAGALMLNGAALNPSTNVLAPALSGAWQEISKSEYQDLLKRSHVPPNQFRGSLLYFWLIIVVAFGLQSLPWIVHIFSIFTVKKRVTSAVPEGYSLPAAVPAQFPQLDTSALEQYTRAFEGQGFVSLGDFSLVPIGKAQQVPIFLRLFTHPRYQCFVEVGQVFPVGRKPMSMSCSVVSALEQDWKIGFADRKPLAAGVFIRMPRSLGRHIPGAQPQELFQAFLGFRNEVCSNLGIRPLKNSTVEDYLTDTQRQAVLRREEMKKKSFTVGLARYFSRSMKPSYEWLGDYPKAAAQRNAQWRAPVMKQS
jgi:hypothetical protein